MRSFLIIACAATALAGAAHASGAKSPLVQAKINALMPVQSKLLAREQQTAGRSSVDCRVVFVSAPYLECDTYTLIPAVNAKKMVGPTGAMWWISKVVSAFPTSSFPYVLANSRTSDACHYRVAVTTGATLTADTSTGGLLNICVSGWVKRVK